LGATAGSSSSVSESGTAGRASSGTRSINADACSSSAVTGGVSLRDQSAFFLGTRYTSPAASDADLIAAITSILSPG